MPWWPPQAPLIVPKRTPPTCPLQLESRHTHAHIQAGCSPLHPALSYFLTSQEADCHSSQRRGHAGLGSQLAKARWVALFHKEATAQLSLAALGMESNLGKAETSGEGGLGLHGLPNTKFSSHSLQSDETVAPMRNTVNAEQSGRMKKGKVPTCLSISGNQ